MEKLLLKLLYATLVADYKPCALVYSPQTAFTASKKTKKTPQKLGNKVEDDERTESQKTEKSS